VPPGNGRFGGFLVVRDDFYSDPDAVRRIAQSMKYYEPAGITGSGRTRSIMSAERAAGWSSF